MYRRTREDGVITLQWQISLNGSKLASYEVSSRIFLTGISTFTGTEVFN
jgi:hypothetical protein